MHTTNRLAAISNQDSVIKVTQFKAWVDNWTSAHSFICRSKKHSALASRIQPKQVHMREQSNLSSYIQAMHSIVPGSRNRFIIGCA
jgi:hypothetical protein